MKALWLGQAGLLLTSGDVTVMIDPYFSDIVKRRVPAYRRRKPVDPRFLEIQPDFLLFTHDHEDHYDEMTASVYFERGKQMTVLAPRSVWLKASVFKNGHNCVEFNAGSEWTASGLRFTAVPAVHSDPFAVGFFIEELSSGARFYITGDTLYSRAIFEKLPSKPDVVFLPINGVGNNMNHADAARFAEATGAEKAVPLHFGMFDEIDPEIFIHPGRVIPTIYEEIPL